MFLSWQNALINDSNFLSLEGQILGSVSKYFFKMYTECTYSQEPLVKSMNERDISQQLAWFIFHTLLKF